MHFEFLSEEWKNHKPSDDSVSDLLNDIICFFRERGNEWPLDKNSSLPRRIGLIPLEAILPKLYNVVYEKSGGYDQVCTAGSWTQVRRIVHVSKVPIYSTHLLQYVYRHILLPYERERSYLEYEREANRKTQNFDRPHDLIGNLIGFDVGGKDESAAPLRVWGRIRGYNDITLDHTCILDDGRIVRTIIRDSNARIGKRSNTLNPTTKRLASLHRYLPEERKIIKLQPPKIWKQAHKYRRKPQLPGVERRIDVVCCACGLQRPGGKMLKCSVCRQLCHAICHVAANEEAARPLDSESFRCFACDNSETMPGTIAHAVGGAITRVRAESKWSTLRRKLRVTEGTTQSNSTNGKANAAESKLSTGSNLAASTNTVTTNSMQTRAKRGQVSQS